MENNLNQKEKYKKYWRESTTLLPWFREGITGDEFAEKLLPYFGPEKHLLEIGPRNGRILISLKKLNAKYMSYTGIDIGSYNVEYAKKNFEDSIHHFILGDAEEHVFKRKFDVIFSSTTLKHFYPSIDRFLRNIRDAMKPDSILISDFLEGKGWFDGGGAWTRRYTKEELTTTLDRNGYYVSKFDTVRHKGAPGRGGLRLLMVAALSPSSP